MSKYIDADEFVRWIEKQERLSKLYTIMVLQEKPKDEDILKVVRCGKCKNWKTNPNNLYGGQCRFSECASIDHYCSRGELKK